MAAQTAPDINALDLSGDAAADALHRMHNPATDALEDGIEGVPAGPVSEDTLASTISATPVLDFLLNDRAVISGEEDLHLYIQQISQAICTL